MKTPDAVIRAYMVITGLYSLSASLIWGVNTLFLLDCGLSILEVFLVNAVFTAAMAMFEIPTGVVADTRGRRLSFLLSVAILIVGTGGYVLAAWSGGGLWAFSAWSVVLGLGYTFYSGAVEAWLVDALNDLGFEGSTDAIFARSAMVFGGAMLVGTIGGGLLGTLDLVLPYIVRCGMLLALFGAAFVGMHDQGFTARTTSITELPREMRRIAQDSLRFGWRSTSLKLLMLASGVSSLSMAWGFHAWQPYFLDLLERDGAWITGLIAAAAALATIGGNMVVEFATKWCGKRTTLLMWGMGVQAIAFTLVGVVNNFWAAVGLYLVAMAASGVYGPVRQAYIHKKVASPYRATVISFDSLVSSSASMGGQAGLGWVAQRFGFGPGYVIGGIIDLLALPLLLGVRAGGEGADKIVGSAGVYRSCPTGLPKAAAVD